MTVIRVLPLPRWSAPLFERGKALLAAYREHDIPGLAAELAFRIFLALVPFLLFLTALGALIAHGIGGASSSERVVELLGDSLPSDAASLIRGQVEDLTKTSGAGVLTIGAAGALWAAAGCTATLMKAMNRLYGVPESRSWLKRTSLSLGLTALGVVALLLAILLLFVTQVSGSAAAEKIGLGQGFGWFVAIVRWPLVAVGVAAATAMLYWAGPDTPLAWRRVLPGVVAFVAGWLVFTVGFALYLANFGSYNATYGALAGVVILLLWLYASCLLLLIGCAANALLSRPPEQPATVAP